MAGRPLLLSPGPGKSCRNSGRVADGWREFSGSGGDLLPWMFKRLDAATQNLRTRLDGEAAARGSTAGP